VTPTGEALTSQSNPKRMTPLSALRVRLLAWVFDYGTREGKKDYLYTDLLSILFCRKREVLRTELLIGPHQMNSDGIT
jgi:hypothetical protein